VSLAALATAASVESPDVWSATRMNAMLQDTAGLRAEWTTGLDMHGWADFNAFQVWRTYGLQAELGLSDSAMATLNGAFQLLRAANQAKWARGPFLVAARQGKRALTTPESIAVDSIEREAALIFDSAYDQLAAFRARLTPTQWSRFTFWRGENGFIWRVVSEKVDQAFVNHITFGPAYYAAPDSLESAWRLLQTSPAFNMLLDSAVKWAVATLPGPRRLSRTDSAKVSQKIRDYRLEVLRVRAELSVADQTVIKLGNHDLIGGNEDKMMADYTLGLARAIADAKTRLLTAVSSLLGIDRASLAEEWIP
jgi:hypothetical protein